MFCGPCSISLGRLTGTSANRHGEAPGVTVEEGLQTLVEEPDLVLDGGRTAGRRTEHSGRFDRRFPRFCGPEPASGRTRYPAREVSASAPLRTTSERIVEKPVENPAENLLRQCKHNHFGVTAASWPSFFKSFVYRYLNVSFSNSRCCGPVHSWKIHNPLIFGRLRGTFSARMLMAGDGVW